MTAFSDQSTWAKRHHLRANGSRPSAAAGFIRAACGRMGPWPVGVPSVAIGPTDMGKWEPARTTRRQVKPSCPSAVASFIPAACRRMARRCVGAATARASRPRRKTSGSPLSPAEGVILVDCGGTGPRYAGGLSRIQVGLVDGMRRRTGSSWLRTAPAVTLAACARTAARNAGGIVGRGLRRTVPQ